MYLRCSLKTKEGFLDLNIDGAAPAKLLFRVNEACSVLGLGRTSLYKEIAAGRLRVVRAAGRTLLARRDLDEYVETLRADAGVTQAVTIH